MTWLCAYCKEPQSEKAEHEYNEYGNKICEDCVNDYSYDIMEGDAY